MVPKAFALFLLALASAPQDHAKASFLWQAADPAPRLPACCSCAACNSCGTASPSRRLQGLAEQDAEDAPGAEVRQTAKEAGLFDSEVDAVEAEVAKGKQMVLYDVKFDEDLHGVGYRLRDNDKIRVDEMMNLHRGQRKTFIANFVALTHFLRKADENCTILYVGAAPGHYLPFLAELFPNTVYDLYDNEPFSKEVLSNSERFRVHKEHLTDETAKDWAGRYDVFFCDIWPAGPNWGAPKSNSTQLADNTPEAQKAFEEEVRKVMDAQAHWCRLLSPKRGCLLKFRPPYVEPSSEPAPFDYLRGRLMWQAWPTKLSTETRLLVEAADAKPDAPTQRFDSVRYQDVCYFHNVVTRPWGTFQIDPKMPADMLGLRQRVKGFDACFDCAFEARAWFEYFALPGAVAFGCNGTETGEVELVGAAMDKLGDSLNQGLTQNNAPPFHGLYEGSPCERVSHALKDVELCKPRRPARKDGPYKAPYGPAIQKLQESATGPGLGPQMSRGGARGGYRGGYRGRGGAPRSTAADSPSLFVPAHEAGSRKNPVADSCCSACDGMAAPEAAQDASRAAKGLNLPEAAVLIGGFFAGGGLASASALRRSYYGASTADRRPLLATA